MQIFGIGIDVVEVDRIAAALARFGDAFAARVFTAAELAYCRAQRRPEQHLAARFAAKEAVAKACGTGIGSNLRWLDMEITRQPAGEPRVTLRGASLAFAQQHRIRELRVSLTHTRHSAAAVAIATTDDPPPAPAASPAAPAAPAAT